MQKYQIMIKKLIVDEFENEKEAQDFIEDWAANESIDLELFEVETECLTKTVLLDTVYPTIDEFISWLKEHHIEMKIINQNGPGGWPVVRYSGSKENLKVMIDRWWDADEWLYQFIE